MRSNDISLSPRQKEVLELLAADYSIREISQKLSRKTAYIKKVTSVIREKFDTRSTLAAAVCAFRMGLIDQQDKIDLPK